MRRIVLLACLCVPLACSSEGGENAAGSGSPDPPDSAATAQTSASTRGSDAGSGRAILSQSGDFKVLAASPAPDRAPLSNFAVLNVPEERPGSPSVTAPATTTDPGTIRPSMGGIGGIGTIGSSRRFRGRWRPPTKRLSMESLDVQVVVDGRLARTQVTQVFRNHHPWQTEGTYAFTLPEGAAVSRLAMDVVPGKLMEGELVERERARQVYEGIVRRMKDPALLEWQGGNRFSTQIFPIPGSGTKTVVLAYEQLLPADGDLVHFHYGLPYMVDKDAKKKLGKFRFTLLASGAKPVEAEGYALKLTPGDDGTHVLTYTQATFEPTGPLRVTFRRPDTTQKTVFSHATGKSGDDDEHFFMLDWVGKSSGGQPPSPPALVVFAVDRSASAGDVALQRAKHLVTEVARKLPAATSYALFHADAKVVACPEEPSPRVGHTLLGSCLEALKAGGGTDLSALLWSAAERAAKASGRAAIVWLSDGIPSLGEVNQDRIEAGLRQRLARRAVALHTVALGHAPDQDFLRRLSRAVGGRAVRLRPGDPVSKVSQDLLWGLAQPLLTDVAVQVVDGGATDLLPASSRVLVPGEPLPILGRLTGASARLRITGRRSGKTFTEEVTLARGKGTSNPLIPGFWARGRIGAMERGHVDRKAVVGMSLKYGVMSRYTSFLVLENDKAYERFGVKRLRDAERQVGQGHAPLKLTLTDAEKRKAKAVELAEDTGVLSVLGGGGLSKVLDGDTKPVAESLLGIGGGGGLGSRGWMPPRKGEGLGVGGMRYPRLRAVVRPGRAKVVGPLDAKIVQRVARRYVAMLRWCYRNTLKRDPMARGRLTLSLAVLPTGRVGKAMLKQGSFKDRRLEQCLLKKVKRMRFPAPNGGGNVAVTIPLDFRSTGGDPLGRVPLKKLMTRKDLSARGEGRVLDLLINKKRDKDADRRLAALKKTHEKAGTYPSSLFDVLSPYVLVRERYPADLEAAALARMKTEPEPAATVLWELWGARRELAKLESRAWPEPTVPLAGRRLAAVAVSDAPRARKVFATWSTSLEWSAKQRYDVLSANGLPTALPEEHYRAVKEVLAATRDLSTYAPRLVDAAVGSKRGMEAAREIAGFCDAPTDVAQLDQCLVWLEQLEQRAPETATVRAEVQGRMVAIVSKLRRDDVANPDLIRRLAHALEQEGDTIAAARVRTEIVEFAPRDIEARRTYAAALVQRKDIAGACAQWVAALQLNPTTQRVVYQAMTDLRRAHKNDAGFFGPCVLDAVSRYPVQRTVAVVVTWDSHDADVDLIVTEPGGEVVRRGHRESKQGGKLVHMAHYGYGPEIYELGSGRPGSYGLAIQRQGGAAEEVRGTVTILRHVGSPKETRTAVPFVLKKTDVGKRVTLESLTL